MKYPAPCADGAPIRYSWAKLSGEKVEGTGTFRGRKGDETTLDQWVTWVIQDERGVHHCLIPSLGDKVEPL